MPIMVLRASDIAAESIPENPEEKKNGVDRQTGGLEDGSTILDMPAASLLSTIAESAVDDAELVSMDSNGSAPCKDTDDAEPLEDPELIELLEQLSVTIDTAHDVLDAAASAPGEAAPSLTSDPFTALEPELRPELEREEEPDDLLPIAAQFASLSSPPPPAREKGASKTMITAISALALIAGIGWLLYSNPWLTEDGTKVATTADTSKKTALNDRLTPVLASAAPAAMPGADRADTASTAPKLYRQSESTPKVPMAPKVSIGKPVAGRVGQPIALAINLPASTAQTEMSIMIQGMPDKAQLSAGKSLGSGNWLLSEAELQNLTINTAASFIPANFNLDVILVRSDGKVPEVHKLAVTIEPAVSAVALSPNTGAAPPSSATTYDLTGITVAVPIAQQPTGAPATTAAPALVAAKPAPVSAARAPQDAPVIKAPAAPEISIQEVKTLLARANSLLELSDVAGARLLLEYAAQRGSKRAMLKLSETYDSSHLSSIGVRGVKPDKKLATLWSNRAAKAAEAK